MAVPNTFATATSPLPLSQLDANFATPITLGSTTVALGDTVTSVTGLNTTGNAGNVTGTVAIANGGTGQTTANTAFNALAPSQTSNSGKYLTTDGTTTSWATVVSGASITNDTSTASALYPLFANVTTGVPTTIYTSNAKLTYNPSTGNFTATSLTSATLTSPAATGLTIQSAGTAVMTIDTSQNTIVGPIPFGGPNTDRFNIVGNSSTTVLGLMYSNTSSNPYFIGAANSPNALIFSDSGKIERVRFDGYGNIGVGTTTPITSISADRTINLLAGTSGASTLYLQNATSGHGSTAGFYLQSTGYYARVWNGDSTFMQFATGNTERMRIDASGNVGIGATSLSNQLEIGAGGTASSNTLQRINSTNTAAFGGGVIFARNGTTNFTLSDAGYALGGSETTGAVVSFPTSADFRVVANNIQRFRVGTTVDVGTSGSNINTNVYGKVTLDTASTFPFQIYSRNTATANPAIKIFSGTGIASNSYAYLELQNYAGGAADQTWRIGTQGSDALSFYDGTSGVNTERMRIDSSGNLLVGTTAAYGGEKFNVTQSAAAGGIIARLSSGPYNNTSYAMVQGIDGTTVRFYFPSNGGLYNYSANNVNLSDVRTKTDIQDAGSYLEKICAIPVRTFKYKDQTDDLLNLGVIAQEVETVAPELVDVQGFGDEIPEDGIPLKGIFQTDLQYALMKSIQELKAINDTQAETINALTARIVALEAK